MSHDRGVLEGTTFVGRKGLLGWLNDFLDSDYDRVEQLASGVAHCQLMDAIYPGRVPLHKVNFDAKFDYEYVRNFKVLQEVFKDLGIPKVIDVNQILKGKYMDNMEFFQWMKKHFDDHYHGRDYPAAERREKARQTYSAGKVAVCQMQAQPARRAAPVASVSANKENKAARANTTSTVTITKSAPARATLSKPAAARPTTSTNNQSEMARLSAEVLALRGVIASLQNERDFYFAKLRDVEIITQEVEVLELATKQDDTEKDEFAELEELESGVAASDKQSSPSNSNAELIAFAKKIQAVLYAEDSNAVSTSAADVEI